MNLDGLTCGVTHTFAAPIDAVWALLTDVERIAGLGPEHTSAGWDSDARGVGAVFHGTNEAGENRWTTRCTVIAWSPPTSFAWVVGNPDASVGTWSYALRPEQDGTTVSQTFTHGSGTSGLTAAIERHPERERQIIEFRSSQLRENMATVLVEAEKLLS